MKLYEYVSIGEDLSQELHQCVQQRNEYKAERDALQARVEELEAQNALLVKLVRACDPELLLALADNLVEWVSWDVKIFVGDSPASLGDITDMLQGIADCAIKLARGESDGR